MSPWWRCLCCLRGRDGVVTAAILVIDDYVFRRPPAWLISRGWRSGKNHFTSRTTFAGSVLLSWWLALARVGLDYFRMRFGSTWVCNAANAFPLWGLLRVLAVQGWATVAVKLRSSAHGTTGSAWRLATTGLTCWRAVSGCCWRLCSLR